jgi:hypothetical protein
MDNNDQRPTLAPLEDDPAQNLSEIPLDSGLAVGDALSPEVEGYESPSLSLDPEQH